MWQGLRRLLRHSDLSFDHVTVTVGHKSIRIGALGFAIERRQWHEDMHVWIKAIESEVFFASSMAGSEMSTLNTFGPTCGCIDAKPASVRKEIGHGMVIGNAANVGSVLSLIKEQTGFLADSWANHKLEIVFPDDECFLKFFTSKQPTTRAPVYSPNAVSAKYTLNSGSESKAMQMSLSQGSQHFP